MEVWHGWRRSLPGVGRPVGGGESNDQVVGKRSGARTAANKQITPALRDRPYSCHANSSNPQPLSDSERGCQHVRELQRSGNCWGGTA